MRKITPFLYTNILFVLFILVPFGIAYAGVTEEPIEETEQVDESLVVDDLDEEIESTPSFFFDQPVINGNVAEPVEVSFHSDKKVSEARVNFPREAKLREDKLPTGVSVLFGEMGEWIVQGDHEQYTFTIPVEFESEGSYEVSIDEAKVAIDINEKKEVLTDENIDHQVEQTEEELETNEKANIEDSSVTKQLENAEDTIDNYEEEAEQKRFEGGTAEVSTMAAFREAVANPEIEIISVQANLSESSSNVMIVDRSLVIQGNGHTLSFNHNDFYFQLEEVNDTSIFRIEDATITKVGNVPLINATLTASEYWTIELEDIQESDANTMRLAQVPKGRVFFTGGVSSFIRPHSTTTFIEAKEVYAANGAEVVINRGSAIAIFSPSTVESPIIGVTNGASISIETDGEVEAVDLCGDRPEILIDNNASLQVNNTIVLDGAQPKLSIQSGGRLIVTSSFMQHGIQLIGENPEIEINDGLLQVTTAEETAIGLDGHMPKITMSKSKVDIVTESGDGVALNGDDAVFQVEDTEVTIESTAGQRLNLIGKHPTLKMNNSKLSMNSSTGQGIYLNGKTPEVILDNSQLAITDTGNARGIYLKGTDALLSLMNGSELNIKGSGAGNSENIQIGDNQARPQLSLASGSKLTVDTTSGRGTPSNIANNAIHIRGSEPKATISENSELKVSVTSNARRGFYLNGSNAAFNVEDSQMNVTTISGRALNLDGDNTSIKTINSNLEITTVEGAAGISFVGDNTLLDLQSSSLNFNGTTGYGVEMWGDKAQVKSSKSDIKLKNTGSANAITMSGEDASMELNDHSHLWIECGKGINENILIGNGYANPVLKVSNHSNISIKAESNSDTATDGSNNSIRVAGTSPIVEVSENSKIGIDVLSGGRRSLFIAGDSATLKVSDHSEIFSKNLYGTAIGMNTTKGNLIADNSSKIKIESSARRTSALIDIDAGGNSIEVKNDASIITKHIEFDDLGKNTQALSMNGSNNHIKITKGGVLDLDNTHFSSSPENGVITGNHATVFFGSGDNRFDIDNEGAIGSRSQLLIVNDYAAALFSEGGHLTFNQNEGTIFHAEGSSFTTREYGVFVAGDTMDFNIHSPYYFDFANVRVGGGDIFGIKSGSTLNITDTLFSAWATGSEFESDPEIGFFKKINVAYEGRDFSVASSNNHSALSSVLPGLSGRVSRISANNSSPIFEGFRQPTNADKSFIAEFSFNEGMNEIREAGTNEITAQIKVTSPDQTYKNYTAYTVGNESPLQTWEEKENNHPGKTGRISVEFEELLEEGTIIEFVSISRGLDEGAIYLPEEELAKIEPITVINVTPPKLVDFGKDLNLTNESVFIEALPNENNRPGNKALLYINDQYIETQTVAEDGSFTFDLQNNLSVGDKVQVLMEDNQGPVMDRYSTIESVFRRPETNHETGNRNPLSSDYIYHDAVFPKAKTYIVERLGHVAPVDPLNPEIEVNPENPPELSQYPGLLSIDFASQINFGSQAISTRDKKYYAQPQLLLNEDGTVIEGDERPNYVQVSDRRPARIRNGWQLEVTQNDYFKNERGHKLTGAILKFTNQEVIGKGKIEPSIQITDPLELSPGNKRMLMCAKGEEGEDTWIYRFGNKDSADESIILDVPGGANPEATSYSTTLSWELSAVPEN